MAKISLGNKAGKSIEVEVDFEQLMLSEAFVASAVRFAVKQALTNTHASIANDEPDAHDKAVAAVEKRLAAMQSGSWGQTERGGVDPVEKEILALAEAALVAAVKSAGKKRKDFEAADWKAKVMKLAKARDAEYRQLAEVRVAETKNLVQDDDIADILGL